MHVLLVVSRLSGHHVSLYLDKLLAEFEVRDWTASIIAPNGTAEHPAYHELQRKYDSPDLRQLPSRWFDGILDRSDGPAIETARQAARHSMIRRLAIEIDRERPVDGVFFISLDHTAHALAIAGLPLSSSPVAGIQTRTRFLSSDRLRHRISRRLFERLTAMELLRAVIVLDDASAQVLRQECSAEAIVASVPEARRNPLSSDRYEVRERYGIPKSSTVVLLYGALSMRKGVRELLNAAVGLVDSGLHILVAGQPDAETEQFLSESQEARWLNNRNMLTCALGYQTEQAIADSFTGADAVWLGYPNDYSGSSGVLEEAIAYQTPVIGTEAGLIGHKVRSLSLGYTVKPEDVDAVRHALRLLPQSNSARTDVHPPPARGGRPTFEAAVCDVMTQAFSSAEVMGGEGHAA